MASVSCHFSQRAARASHYGYTVCVISTGIVCARASFMVAKRFEDLIVWQRAHELQEEIFSFTAHPPTSNDFKFCQQIRDSARSATRNIAEGYFQAGDPLGGAARTREPNEPRTPRTLRTLRTSRT